MVEKKERGRGEKNEMLHKSRKKFFQELFSLHITLLKSCGPEQREQYNTTPHLYVILHSFIFNWTPSPCKWCDSFFMWYILTHWVHFRPPSDGGLMIPPRTLGDVFVKRLVYLFLLLFIFLYFNYELRGVIGRAMASHAIDPGSNPGHAMYIFFQVC